MQKRLVSSFLAPGDVSAPSKEKESMAYVVTDACVKDFVCRDACPTGSIRPEPGDPGAEAASQVFINADDCIDCGSCAGICPQNAIFAEDELPPAKAQSAERNRAYFQ